MPSTNGMKRFTKDGLCVRKEGLWLCKGRLYNNKENFHPVEVSRFHHSVLS